MAVITCDLFAAEAVVAFTVAVATCGDPVILLASLPKIPRK